MNDIQLLDAVERYIRGEMRPDERLQFENLRKANSEVDQLVVGHTLFLQQLNHFGERKNLRSSLNDIHTDLTEQGKIDSMKLKGRGKIVYLWKRYRRVAAIAASIAGITALGISALVWAFAPKKESAQVTELVSKVNQLDVKTRQLDTKIDKVDKDSKTIIKTPVRYNGTGFLIDGKGYLATNAHVVKNSKNIYVQNNKGEQYKVKVVKLDLTKDIAILKIEDAEFKTLPTLPYGIRKSSTNIAEPLYTLGFPRNEIVYGEGYLSARTGFNGDTLSCQIAVAANPGNSGGPVFNNNGEIIGILSTKERQTEGAVFAIQSKYIYQVLDELKKDTAYAGVKIPLTSSVRGMNKQQQVQKIQDYVFMVKGD
ncbi:MAG: S1C family serine protease [Bacteroidota bacterium]